MARKKLVVAILGLGEAGAAIARDLVSAGVNLRGWDPAPRGDVSDIPMAASGPAVVKGAQIVLSVNVAAVACDVARGVAAALTPGQLYADLNTSGPQLKRDIAAIVEPTGARFVDVALMAQVPGNGLHTPSLVSGSGATQFRDLMAPLGMPIEVVGVEPGEAATRKLLRSVYMKGWAAAIIEALEAARRVSAEAEEWLYQDIAHEFVTADERKMRRLIEGSHAHAVRRTEEMVAASELLTDLGMEPRVASAAAGWLRELAAESASH